MPGSRTCRRGYRQKRLELGEAPSQDSTNEARQIIATLMGSIGIELMDGACFSPDDDISGLLLVYAAGNVFQENGCGDRI